MADNFAQTVKRQAGPVNTCLGKPRPCLIKFQKRSSMIQLELRPEVESQLAAEAQARGLEVAHYVEQIVEQRTRETASSPEERRQAVEAMRAFRREHKLILGGIELRDLIHDGHKY
jgi:hypothetical protein